MKKTRSNDGPAPGPWTYGPNEHGFFMCAAYCSRCGANYMTGYTGTREEVRAIVQDQLDHCECKAKR